MPLDLRIEMAAFLHRPCSANERRPAAFCPAGPHRPPGRCGKGRSPLTPTISRVRGLKRALSRLLMSGNLTSSESKFVFGKQIRRQNLRSAPEEILARNGGLLATALRGERRQSL